MRSIALVLSLVLVLLGACSEEQNPLSTQNSNDNASGVMLPKPARPFQGTGTGVVTTLSSILQGPGYYLHTLDLTGPCDVSHMGLSQAKGTAWSNWYIGNNFYGDLTMDVILTAANGDRLFFDVAANFASPNFTAWPPFPTVVNFTGTYTITGGDGRFEGASGSGTLNAQEELLDGGGSHVATLSWSGTIIY